MSADSPNWLSVEQREGIKEHLEAFKSSQMINVLLDSHAEADRREAELREQLAAKDAEIIKLEKARYLLVEELIKRMNAKDAEIARERHVRESQQHGQRAGDLYVENERFRAALDNVLAACSAAGLWTEAMSIAFDLAHPAEALAATLPAKEGK